MFKNTLRISGKIENEIKEKDGKYYLLLHINLNNDEKNKSLVYVDITKKIYKKIKDTYKGSCVIISGNIQAKKTKKDVPYIYLKCQNLTLLSNKEQKNDNEMIDKQIEENEKNIQAKNSVIPWQQKFNESDFELIETSKVCLVEDEHLKATIFFNKEWKCDDKPIAVRKLDDGTYTLVTGFKWYVYAKLLNKPYIKAHITELSFKEFRDKYVDA